MQTFAEERRLHRRLTARESQVLEMVSKGLNNSEIGQVLGLSRFTIRNQIVNILRKLDVSDRTEAATAGIARGVITPVSHGLH